MAFTPLIGGITILGSDATRLSDVDQPMVQLTLRGIDNPNRIYFGNSDVSPSNFIGYVDRNDAYQWGPYQRGGGVRPAQIFVIGTVGDRVVWSAFPA